MSTDELRDELHRIGDAARRPTSPDDTWARARALARRDRALVVAGASPSSPRSRPGW